MISKYQQQKINKIAYQAIQLYKSGLSTRDVSAILKEEGIKKSHTWVWLQVKGL